MRSKLTSVECIESVLSIRTGPTLSPLCRLVSTRWCLAEQANPNVQLATSLVFFSITDLFTIIDLFTVSVAAGKILKFDRYCRS